ncbi:LacI family DNA-binding transcriptional regulator [Aquibacillus albus]|uniref:LacI family transcriptional regulator n=1 Tax=Aquibacillus albus TaxID=1168171 RepID=A0ABS2N555_9BACI|nr:LacI family DNA-binding transcriptional regulator [Aquibacillus albus]MBM7573015.1 LacI family transcriptional regulator [Aquibacillus albus]
MNKKPTIKEVAKYAGVSPATVSYVLNGVKKVSNETKKRVLEAVDQLNYYPDFTAISLSKRKSNLIGIMLPLIEDTPASVFKNNFYYTEFVSGVELVSRNRKFDTMITGVGNPEECRQWVKKRNLDGLIFLGLFPEKLYNEMKTLNIPIVLIDTYEKYTNLFSNIQVNDELGGYLAASHLIELGHKDIAFIATDLKSSPVDAKRYQGYKRALQETGIKFNEKLTYQTYDITFEHGKKVAEEILKSEQKPTGIVTVSDVLAIGIMKALQMKHIQVPNDYSIVGFDDLSISEYTTPSLTTVRQDIFEKGKYAANLLINAIESEDVEHQTVELPVELIIRQSTKAL